MKTLLCMLACAMATGTAPAAGTATDGVCSSHISSAEPADALVQRVRAPIELAIATLDNAQVALPSPSLASGTIGYVTVSPIFANQLDKVCVLGYFELGSGAQARTLPLVLESAEVVKTARRHDASQTVASARIYFHVPALADFGAGTGAPAFWKFWAPRQMLHLKIAAFDYAAGSAGRPIFGRDQNIAVSDKGVSTVAACLFAVFFYVVAGVAVPRAADPAHPAWHRHLARLAPWNITGASGQVSLSQLQMLVFTLIVATLLFYQWLRTGLLEELSTDLLYLIGISTAGTAATEIATSIRKDLEPAIYQYLQQLAWFTAPVAAPSGRASAKGLLMTNDRFDIYKFQMLVFSFVIAAYVIASGADELGKVRISATLLTLMGMSQGAYVGGRAAVDTLGPLQDQLRGMRALQQRYASCQDGRVREQLRRQFELAAHEAGSMFNAMFGRVLSEAMLLMPPDSDCGADVPERAPPL